MALAVGVLRAAAAMDAASGVQMTVRRTFIELVAPPSQECRTRALTDSAVFSVPFEGAHVRGDTASAAASRAANIDVTPAVFKTEASSVEEPAPMQWPVPTMPATPGLSYSGSPKPSAAVPWNDAHMCMPGAEWMPMHGPAGHWWFPSSAYEQPYAPMQGYVAQNGAASYQQQQIAASASTPRTEYGEAQARSHGGATTRWFGQAAETQNTAKAKQEDVDPADSRKTTVMLRNLPTELNRNDLLEILEGTGFVGAFDFVYLPIDFSSQRSLGYAFVNFLAPAEAYRCWSVFDGFVNWGRHTDKPCEVMWGNPHQGLEAHIERYRNSPVMHENVPDAWRPVLYNRGVRVSFPPPTRAVKAPKMRSRQSLPPISATA